MRGPWGRIAQGLESAGGVGAKIDHGEEVGPVAILELLGRVAIEEGDVEPGVNHRLAQGAHVSGVLAEESVFVFDLDHENRAAAGDLERTEHAADLAGDNAWRLGDSEDRDVRSWMSSSLRSHQGKPPISHSAQE